MFVEKLSVFGFKSFNQKVSLDFGAGISGVIGPNGCGKSNIVDAIRWVLGEQSTKQLRGAKMEDVIFNGTRTEKPLSLAEVELTLNNDAGRLPIEYSTVTVGRRLYRSGVSEYVINKKPVRLRDIRDLFVDTGMGSHAYSVIERQMVDNILSDTTGHRRFLFEEAAGITKYKARKKEALGKLEATERDLLRVQDIISEVERQVNSLKRQVGKARRYRELSAEIRDLDLAYSQRERAGWLESLHGLEARFGEDLRAAETAETEVATVEARLEALHLEVVEHERRLGEARESLAEVDDAIGSANSRVLVLRERLTSTKNRIREAKEHGVRLADRLERNATAAVEAAERLAQLAEREVAEQDHLTGGEGKLEAVEVRVRELRGKVSERKREAARLRDERIRAEGAVESARGRRLDLEGRATLIEDRLGAATTRLQEFTESLQASRSSVERATHRVTELRAQRDATEALRGEQDLALEQVQNDLNANRREEAALRARLTTLEDLQARYEGFDPGVRAVMVDAERDPGVKGTLADLVKVPSHWVRALEPALSPVWQVIVVDTTQTARALVTRLREKNLGYAVILPLDRVPELAAPQGADAWASEVVETADTYRHLVRYLLQGLLLVDTLDAALTETAAGRAERAATALGELVDTVRIAGGHGGPAGSELVEREESLDRCRKELADRVAVLDGLNAHDATLRATRAELEQTFAQQVQELQRGIEAKASLEKEEAALELQRRHAEQEVGNQQREQASLAQALARLVEEIQLLEAQGAQAAGKAEQEESELAVQEAAMAGAEQEREAVLSDVHGMRMSWARLEAEMADARGAADRLQHEAVELQAEAERTARDAAESEDRVVEIEEELETLTASIQQLHGQRNERSEVVAQRHRERSEAAAREHTDAEALREIRRRANQARQAAHSAELQINQLRNDLRHMHERLRQDYEVTPEDLDRLPEFEIPENAADTLGEMKDRMRRLGPVNLLAVEEYEEKSQRFEFMSTQRDDLLRAKDSLIKTISEINKTASKMFVETFTKVQENFQKTFQVLFQGGECSLTLSDDDPLEAEIDVVARPRGKKPQGIHQLSSGERALTAIALLFAIYLVKPSPFCILDEVDAPLDDANIDRFVAMVKEFSNRTQFIVITHNKKTMEAADCLYGVTMQRPGVSTVVSVKLEGDRAEGVVAARGTKKAVDEGMTPSTVDDVLSPESAIAQ